MDIVAAIRSVPVREWGAVLGALVVILAMASGVFWLLVRRWTTQRQWLAMQDWADENRFVLHGEKRAVAPEVLKSITQPAPKVLISLNDVDTGLIQIEAAPPRGTNAPAVRWNLLIRKIEKAWPTTGLRPAA